MRRVRSSASMGRSAAPPEVLLAQVRFCTGWIGSGMGVGSTRKHRAGGGVVCSDNANATIGVSQYVDETLR